VIVKSYTIATWVSAARLKSQAVITQADQIGHMNNLSSSLNVVYKLLQPRTAQKEKKHLAQPDQLLPQQSRKNFIEAEQQTYKRLRKNSLTRQVSSV